MKSKIKNQAIAFTIVAFIVGSLVYFLKKGQSLDDSTETKPIGETVSETIVAAAKENAESKSTSQLGLNDKKKNADSFLLEKIQKVNWHLDGGLAEHFAYIQSKADGGDNEAQFIFATNLRYCYSAPLNVESLDSKLTEVSEFSDAERTIQRITDKYEYCLGVESSSVQKFYQYLVTSAEGGYVQAQEELGRMNPEFFMASQGYENKEREEFIRIRDEFNQLRLSVLEDAAMHGSERALKQLSRMYSSQKFGDNSFVRAYAMNQLIMEITEDSELYNRHSWLNQKNYDKLTPKEVDMALDMSVKWFEVILSNGTIYTD